MADVQIPREAVEVAARAIQHLDSGDVDKWDDLLVMEKRFFQRSAEHALKAAAPLIVAAAFDRMAHDVDSTGTSEDGEFHRAFKAGLRWFKDTLRQHAELLRGES